MAMRSLVAVAINIHLLVVWRSLFTTAPWFPRMRRFIPFIPKLFSKRLSSTPGLADDLAESAVAHSGSIEDDGLELGKIDLSIGQNAFVCALVDDLADEHTVLEIHYFALQCKRVLVDDGGVHIRAWCDGKTDLCHLIWHLVAAHKAEMAALIVFCHPDFSAGNSLPCLVCRRKIGVEL